MSIARFTKKTKIAIVTAALVLASIFHREALGRCDGLRITVWV